jgi:drug/metabolite transporter (DMT)-like permease
VLYKRLPRSHPVATNAVAVSSGALLLLVLSLLTGETWTLPGTTSAVMAVSYLVLVGSVVLFYLYLYVLSRWTASATSYAFLLFPVATIIIASWLAGETISAMFIAGGVLVMLGVWLGALSNSRKAQAIRTAPRIPC